jgi:D-aminopeptidase
MHEWGRVGRGGKRRIDLLFEAAAEATQEAVYDALANSDTKWRRGGHRREGLRHALARKRGKSV